MAVEYQTGESWGPPGDLGPYREGDYRCLPDEPRCELLYGSLLVTPSPLVRHQLVLGRLHALFFRHAEAHEGTTILAPMDVRLADHSIVQPDLIYVTAARREVIRERIFGPPDLLVEILSPSTARRDLGPKLKLYSDSGVAEYWIVDPQNETFEFLENRDGAFVVRLPEGGVYRSRAVEELELDLASFWKGLPQ